MKYGMNIAFKIVLMVFLIAPSANVLRAEAKIIQNEKMSFEKCLQVISISQDRLSIKPKIKDASNEKRIAVFKLSDGTLTITCDSKNESVVVSIEEN